MVDNQGSHVPDEIWYPWRETECMQQHAAKKLHLHCTTHWHFAGNGISPADCVFPAFLFLVGFSVVLALTKYQTQWASAFTREAKVAVLKPVLYKVFTRFAKLFLIGAFINLWAGGFHFEKWVIMGVLQRIAVCYAVVALLYVFLPSRVALRIAVLTTLGMYCAIMYGVDVPDCGRAHLTPECNASGFASRQLWGSSHVPSDGTIPEGLVSTLAAIVTTHAGLEFSLVMRRAKHQHASTLLLLWCIMSAAYIVVGAVLTMAVPLNKKLWSPPFALIVAGVAGSMMALWLFLVDLRCGVDLPAAWWTLPCVQVSPMQTAVARQHGAPASPNASPIPASIDTHGKRAVRSDSSLNASSVPASGSAASLAEPLLQPADEEMGEPNHSQAASVQTSGHSKKTTEGSQGASAAAGDSGVVLMLTPAACCGCDCWTSCCGGRCAESAFMWACKVVDVVLLQPLVWLGRNPAFIFIAMVALEVLLMDTLKHDGTAVWTQWYKHGMRPDVIGAQAASSCVALVTLVFWTAVAGVMHYFKLFITL